MALLLFLRSFGSVSDGDVTPRYRYGELSLGRINFYIKFYERRFFYRKVIWQYRDLAVSVALAANGMQVVLAAQQPNGNQTVPSILATSFHRRHPPRRPVNRQHDSSRYCYLPFVLPSFSHSTKCPLA
ncbi:hypothetical protein BGY98DRAFT_700414 [Russula aff. rugulosa BPL654]|nr:hypothetical protein BGY98DRAFT_700414 [Russula aff. rugulosa BPL654]